MAPFDEPVATQPGAVQRRPRASSPAPLAKTPPASTGDKENFPARGNVPARDAEGAKHAAKTSGAVAEARVGHWLWGCRPRAVAATLLAACAAGWGAFSWGSAEHGDLCHSSSCLSPNVTDLQPLRPNHAPGIDLWLTAGARSLMKRGGKLYHEVALGSPLIEKGPQIGWLSEQFGEGDFDGHGVGDHQNGWAADGVRHLKWHKGETLAAWPDSWRGGDVIGLAVDFEAGTMQFSLNGQWVTSAGLRFDPSVPLFPAVSMSGVYRMNVPSATWQFAPPDGTYEAWASSGVYTRPSAEQVQHYRVGGGELAAGAPPAFHRSATPGDAEDEAAAPPRPGWGTVVAGVAAGPDWVKVGTLFLPVAVDGKTVLRAIGADAYWRRLSRTAAERSALRLQAEAEASGRADGA